MRDIELNPIGNFCYGGQLAGYIDAEQSKYALNVSPKEFEAKLNTSTTGTQSYNDGWYNTLSINDDAHLDAKYCASLSIGGYNDWYLPIRDELEVCYGSFKPDNSTGSLKGLLNGENFNSSGCAYSATNPNQTAYKVF